MLANLWLESDDVKLPPKGTYNVLSGLGSTVGAALTSSPLVDIVSMTGSVPTGKAIMKACAEHMTKVSALPLAVIVGPTVRTTVGVPRARRQGPRDRL